jgi:hypothetical protein
MFEVRSSDSKLICMLSWVTLEVESFSKLSLLKLGRSKFGRIEWVVTSSVKVPEQPRGILELQCT